MSYESLKGGQPIRQGDIFFPLPCPNISLDDVQAILEDGDLEATNWINAQKSDTVLATVELEKAWGIVATQDCDAAWQSSISLFRIRPFEEVYGSRPKKDSGWVSTLTERICKNASWFYLPKDEGIGIEKEMAANFHEVFQVQRTDLLSNINLRKGRLANFAYEHYREAIAQYFRRYPYNEWYPFNKAQLEAYAVMKKCSVEEIVPKYPMNER
ncbi:MAG: hypothetical protein AB9879_09990 [Methanothrix sp.]